MLRCLMPSSLFTLQVRVTQSLKLCYAGCYARLFHVNKKRRKCYTETRYDAFYFVRFCLNVTAPIYINHLFFDRKSLFSYILSQISSVIRP